MGLEFATRSDTDDSEWAAVPARGQPWTICGRRGVRGRREGWGGRRPGGRTGGW